MPVQSRTHAARESQLARFASDEEKAEYYRDLGKRSNADRIVLSRDEVQALGAAYALLRKIAARHPDKIVLESNV